MKNKYLYIVVLSLFISCAQRKLVSQQVHHIVTKIDDFGKCPKLNDAFFKETKLVKEDITSAFYIK